MIRIDPISCRVLLVGTLVAAALGATGQARAAVSANVLAGVLTVTGDGADDAIAPRCTGGNVEIPGVVVGGAPLTCTTINAVNVVGGAGADAIDLRGLTVADFTLAPIVTVNGGDGDDTATGSEFDDQVAGEGGNDVFITAPGMGDDTMLGGAGSDTHQVNGIAEDEVFTVRPSPLVVNGGAVDLVGSVTTRTHFGSVEALVVDGGEGADTLLGLDASSVTELAGVELRGGHGDDLIDLAGWVGAPATFLGGAGADTLVGGNGADTLIGGTEDDTVTAGRGDDVTRWAIGDGRDTLIGGDGNDIHQITGSEQNDVFTVDLRKEPGSASTVRILHGGSRAADLFEFDRVELALGDGSDGVLISENSDTFSFGTVAIDGGAGADSMTVRGTTSDDEYTIRAAGSGLAMERGAGSTYAVELAATEEIDIRGRGGADKVDAGALQQGVDLELFGGLGDDTLIGGAGDDTMRGGRGNDDLRGKRGTDRLLGQRGRDTLIGGAGPDTLFGAAGGDVASGGSGNDRILGGQGADLVRAGAGRDRLDGGSGRDRLFGQGGNDKLFGRRGDDVLVGGRGSDTVDGGSGFDEARGVEFPPGIADRLRRIERIA